MLTLLLTLKDRYEFTEHILFYFNEVRFKYPILIADGSSYENQEKLKNAIHQYGNLSIELQNYPPDKGLSDYYNKLKKASDSVQTKYTLLIDNDDYFSERGCDESIQFLENNPSYSAAGQLCLFINSGDKVFFQNAQYSDFDSEQVSGRVEQYLKTPTTIWGLVMHTTVVQKVFGMIAECNFRYLHLMEFIFNLYILNSGKIKYLFNEPCTFRRMITNNSASMSFIEGEKHYNFYYKDFFYPDWRKFISTTGSFLTIDEKLLEKYWFRGCVNGWLDSSAVRKRLKAKEFIRKLYYNFKYRKNWSPDVRSFEMILQRNKK